MNSKECLKRLKQETCPATYMPDFDKDKCIEVIEKDLDRLEKLKKVIEILKNKKVVVGRLFDTKSSEQYNMPFEDNYEECCLTQEEYDLLKEWLNNEQI